jgi:hypothetical protein
MDDHHLLQHFGGSKVWVIVVPISTGVGQRRSGQHGSDYIIVVGGKSLLQTST